MQKLLKKLKEKNLLMTHVVIGYPSLTETIKIITTMAESGVDIIELQMPFSDPIADGPVIMKANEIALKNGTTTKDCMKIMKDLSCIVKIPLLFMGYFNTIFNYGIEKFCKDAFKAGCQGLIIPDMPIEEEEQEKFYHYCEKYNLAPILVIAPSTPNDRLKKLAKFAKAFVYCVARKGVTGEKTDFQKDFQKYINNVKKYLKIPLAVGFGILEKKQVEFVHKHAQIAVVGSVLIKEYEKNKLMGIENLIKKLKK